MPAPSQQQPWPFPVASETRPWTRWWWLGSALDEKEIDRHLTLFHEAGIGGVEVSPIYGVKGYESRWVSFLSPRWVELLGYTIREAKKRGMGVDLIAGTGWPYGGPWVTEKDAAHRLVWETLPSASTYESLTVPGAPLLAVSPPDKEGHVTAAFLGRTKQQVKRAAPGGEGSVVDHLHGPSMDHYLAAFDKPLGALPHGEMVRCFFQDSYEVYNANGAPDLFTEWRKRRGYDPAPYLRELHTGEGDAETVRRVRSDYRETVADLLHEGFLDNWNDWARKTHGARTRYQAHGSPGNLLDLYAGADIPETELFGPIRLKLSGLSAPRPVTPDFGEEEEILVCKMASSAAHVAGKPLCSSESFTWLGEHGCVPLSHMKTEVDLLLAMGMNHLFFHGSPFSPADAPWPGWLFYATTHCAPTNSWWRDFGALNQYIARCQSVLQQGVPDNDVLLYFPFYDLIGGESGAKDGLMFMEFHNSDKWMKGNMPAFAETGQALWKDGWGFDMVSDRQLHEDIVADGKGLAGRTGGAKWKTLLIAGCRTMPPETLERIAQLAKDGATVCVLGDLPSDVPGLGNLKERRERLAAVCERIGLASAPHRLLSGDNLSELLRAAGCTREMLADHGIEHLRRRTADGKGWVYFLSNPTTKDVDAQVALSVPGRSHRFPPSLSVHLLDPMTGASGVAEAGEAPDGRLYLHLALPAGASLLAMVSEAPVHGPSTWNYPRKANTTDILPGPWQVTFLEGGPTLPSSRTVTELTDWTTWDGPDRDALRAFSGTTRYQTTFDAPNGATAARTLLDIGEIEYGSARVRLNGSDLGTVYSRPWRIPIPGGLLKPTGNVLEIEVTNLMANRLSALEKQVGDKWRPFLMVDIRYKGFDAAMWEPVASGLTGPVRLIS